jgi:hypothetical protein
MADKVVVVYGISRKSPLFTKTTNPPARVVAVVPAFTYNCPAPRLYTLAILRAVLAGTSVAEVSDVKLPEEIAVDEIANDAVTEPICAVPAPIVTVPPPIVTTPMWLVPAVTDTDIPLETADRISVIA